MKTLVVGGGPAGLFAAFSASSRGDDVLLLEKNKIPGKKLLLTGEGRCNVTSTLSPEGVLDNVFVARNFLYSALYSFSPTDTRKFFAKRGLKLKEERGRRLYPVTDRAESVRKVLVEAVRAAGGEILTGRETVELIIDNKIEGVRTAGGDEYTADRVILAAGGSSYPSTGSDGSGFELARQAGHRLHPRPRPALVPLKSEEEWLKSVAGLKLKNIELSLMAGEEVKFSDIGEVELREDEIGGSLGLLASCHYEESEEHDFRILLDLKPGLSREKLDGRLQRDFYRYSNKMYKNVYQDLLPAWLRPVIVDMSGISPERRVHQIDSKERRRICQLLKNIEISLSGTAGFKRAIITAGGVDTDEIVPGSMASRIAPGLFLAGEMLAPAAYTGGHNLQIAFSTGFLAGRAGD